MYNFKFKNTVLFEENYYNFSSAKTWSLKEELKAWAPLTSASGRLCLNYLKINDRIVNLEQLEWNYDKIDVQ